MAKQVITIILEDDAVIKNGEMVKTGENSGKLAISFHLNNANDDAEGLSAIFPMAIQQVTEFAKQKVDLDNRKIIKH